MNFLATFIPGAVIATASLFASATSAEARCTQQCYHSQGYLHCRQHCIRVTCPSGYYLGEEGFCFPHATTHTFAPPFDTSQQSPAPFVTNSIPNNIDLDTIFVVSFVFLFLILALLDDDQSKVIERIEQAAAYEWQQAQYAQEQAAHARAAAAQLEYHMQQERQRARALGYQQG